MAIDKQDIEGMSALLREVRRGPGQRSRSTPLYFVSASPAQMRPVVQRKMLLDGLEFDGTIFKDWLGVLKSLRPARFKEQLGFKVTALLHLRLNLPAGSREVLIGDDLETDALAFSIYADAIGGRLADPELTDVLLRHGVSIDDARDICWLRSRLLRCDGVKRAYIRLERNDSPEAFLDFWPRLVPCRNAFQMALGMWAEGNISARGVGQVVRDMHRRGRTADDFGSWLQDACRRGVVAGDALAPLLEDLSAEGLMDPPSELPGVDPLWLEAEQAAGALWTPPRFTGEEQ
jgi:hypothetical protein